MAFYWDGGFASAARVLLRQTPPAWPPPRIERGEYGLVGQRSPFGPSAGVERDNYDVVAQVLEDCRREVDRVAEQQRQSLQALSVMYTRAAEKLRECRRPPMTPPTDPFAPQESAGRGHAASRREMAEPVEPAEPEFFEVEDDDSSSVEGFSSEAAAGFRCCGSSPSPAAAAPPPRGVGQPKGEPMLEGMRLLTETPDVEVEDLWEARDAARDAKRVVPENAVQSLLLPVIESQTFQIVAGTLVCLNACILAYTTDRNMRLLLKHEDLPREEQFVLFIIENVCLALFAAELALRFLAEQRAFLLGPNWRWNLFESFVLLAALMEDICGTGEVATTIRIARIFRMFRAVRVVRLFRFLLHLRLMLFSVLSCLASLIWALVLLALVICIFALYFETVAVFYLEDDKVDHEVWGQLHDNWNGVGPAVRSLVYSISGGDSWGLLAGPFWVIHPIHGLVYMAYVLFITFGLLNILVGVFVQEADTLALWDEEVVLSSALDKAGMTAHALQEMFDDMDVDGVGAITLPQLIQGMGKAKTSAWLRHLQIDIGHCPAAFCDLVELDSSGRLPRERFINACGWLSGGAKPLIVAKLGLQANAVMELLKRVADAVGVAEKEEIHASRRWSLH